MLSEVFWTFLITTVCGLIFKLSSMAYKSKCKEVACCCLKIVREVEIEEKELTNNYKFTSTKTNEEMSV